MLINIDGRQVKVNNLYKGLPEPWSCPGCTRQISSIARMSNRGAWIAFLVEHHDHIKDFPNSFMRLHLGESWVKEVPRGTGDFLNKIESFVAGFSDSVICEDCNNAEAEAKKLIQAPQYFSFAPLEIRKFIEYAPSRVHEVSVTRAMEVFSYEAEDFRFRMTSAEEFVERVLKGQIWKLRR